MSFLFSGLCRLIGCPLLFPGVAQLLEQHFRVITSAVEPNLSFVNGNHGVCVHCGASRIVITPLPQSRHTLPAIREKFVGHYVANVSWIVREIMADFDHPSAVESARLV